MNSLKTKQRDYGIDLLRIISMLMVTTLHVLGSGGVINAAIPFSLQYEYAWLLESFLLVAVNCFVLITGYVYYGKETKYYRLLTLWAEVLFYSIIIIIGLKLVFPNEIGLKHYLKAIIPTFFTDGYFSGYWFFTAYVGMFLLSPFVNIGLKHFNIKQDFAVFLTLFIIFSLLPSILIQTNAFNLNSGYSCLWFIVLYYTGGLIHKYDVFKIFKRYKWILIYIACVLISWTTIYTFESLSLIKTGFHLHSFNCYLSPLYFIGSIALFCVFKTMNISKSFVISIIKFFTPICFGVYLIHSNSALAPLIIEGKFAFLAQMNPNFMIIGIILMGLGTFIICGLIDWIRELIFRKLEIKSRFAKFEENVYLKFDNYLNLKN